MPLARAMNPINAVQPTIQPPRPVDPVEVEAVVQRVRK